MDTIETQFEPWKAPRHAVPVGGGLIPVNTLPPHVLREMAREWLAALYDNAGQPYDWRFD